MARRIGTLCVALAFALGLAAGLGACGSSSGGGAYVAPTGPAVKTLVVNGDHYSFAPDSLSAPAGIIEIRLKSEDINHSFVIEGVPGFQIEAAAGSTKSGKVDLKKGKYTFYCDIVGHRAQGMVGTLTVG